MDISPQSREYSAQTRPKDRLLPDCQHCGSESEQKQAFIADMESPFSRHGFTSVLGLRISLLLYLAKLFATPIKTPVWHHLPTLRATYAYLSLYHIHILSGTQFSPLELSPPSRAKHARLSSFLKSQALPQISASWACSSSLFWQSFKGRPGGPSRGATDVNRQEISE